MTELEVPSGDSISKRVDPFTVQNRLAINNVARLICRNSHRFTNGDIMNISRVVAGYHTELESVKKLVGPNLSIDADQTVCFDWLCLLAMHAEDEFKAGIALAFAEVVNHRKNILSPDGWAKESLELLPKIDRVLLPFGYSVYLEPDVIDERFYQIKVLSWDDAPEETVIVNMKEYLKTNHPIVSKALNGAYSAMNSLEPSMEMSVLDMCRNAIQNLVLDISKEPWPVGLNKIMKSESEILLIKSLFSFLSGKGWAHARKEARPQEIWIGIRMTENIIGLILREARSDMKEPFP